MVRPVIAGTSIIPGRDDSRPTQILARADELN